jgi:hypothetical protein
MAETKNPLRISAIMSRFVVASICSKMPHNSENKIELAGLFSTLKVSLILTKSKESSELAF